MRRAADRSFYDEQLAAARASLDEAAWKKAWSEGQTMTMEEAVAYALEHEEKPVAEPPASP